MSIDVLEGKLSDEKVVVKLSLCGKCNGVVRVAIKHMMNTKSKNEFSKEVMEYNLSVKEMPLLEYREHNPQWCKCVIN